MKTVASRLWLFGWIAAWVYSSRRVAITPASASMMAFLFGATGFLFGLYLFFRGFERLQRKRWLEDTPITKISAAAIGPVKIFGKATGPYTLISPLAGADCYYYRAIASNGRDEQNEQQVEEFAEEIIFTPLFVEDESGRLMIDPRDAQLELPDEYAETISGASMTECARRFLHRHGLSTITETTVTEWVIKPGDPLLVLGTLSEGPDAKGPGVEQFYLSAEAADLQRRERLEEFGVPGGTSPNQPPRSASTFSLHPRVILAAGANRAPFVLSRENPQRMIARLARSSVLDIWGGPALALFSLGLLFKWLRVW